jgi:hypothetical protein
VLPGLPCDNSLKEKIDIWTEKIIESLAILEKVKESLSFLSSLGSVTGDSVAIMEGYLCHQSIW